MSATLLLAIGTAGGLVSLLVVALRARGRVAGWLAAFVANLIVWNTADAVHHATGSLRWHALCAAIDGQTTRFVWDGDAVVHEVRDNAPCVTWLTEPFTHAPVARVEGDARWSVLTDHLGTPEALFDEAGQIAWQAQLDLYGVPRTDVAQVHCPWRWPGQYEDPETGLYYNRFRYYDPEAGQYISPDPLEFDGGLTLFAYVDDPLAYFDYFGLIDGGSHYRVRTSKAGMGGEVNHAPAYASFKNLSGAPGHGAASAFWMDTADHQKTLSWGSSAEAAQHRLDQNLHIQSNNYHLAVLMDVEDVTQQFPGKYNQGLNEMLDHHVDNNRITPQQRDDIKAQCNL